MSFLKFPITVAFALCATNAWADENLDKLDYLLGKWTVSTSFFEDGAWQEPLSTDRAVVDTHLGGSFYRMDFPVAFSGATFQFETTISYDKFHQAYRVAFLDDLNGYMDIFDGNLIDGKLTIDNAKSGTAFPDGNGGEVFGKVEFSKTDTGYMIMAYISGNPEGPYDRYMRIIFLPVE